MPEIDREKVREMLAAAPQDQHESILQRMKERGFTVKGAELPKSSAGQPIYPQPEPTKVMGMTVPPALAAAGQAATAPWSEHAGAIGRKISPEVGAAAEGAAKHTEETLGKIPDALGKVPIAGRVLKPVAEFAGDMVRSPGAVASQVAGGAAAEVAAPFAAKAIAPIAKFAKPYITGTAEAMGNAMADFLGELAGKDPESIKVFAKNPKAMWNKAGELFGRQHQSRVINAIETDFAERGKQFEAIEDSLTGNFGTPSYGKSPDVMTRPAFDDVRFDMAKSGFRLPKGLIEGFPEPKVPLIAHDVPEYKFLVENIKNLKENPRMNFGDALRMRRNLDKAIDYGLEGSSGMQPVSEDANRLLRKMRQKLNGAMGSSLNAEDRAAWSKVNSEYSVASTSRAELKKQVLGQNARLTEKKLYQLLKEGRYDDEVMDRAADLGAKSKARLEDMRDHIAARQFRSMGGKTLSVMPTSPKAIGYLASAGGAAGQGMSSAVETLARTVKNYPYIVGALATHLASQDQKQAPPQP